MTFDYLANLMFAWGWKIKDEHYEAFENYLKKMLMKKRVMIVWNGPFIDAVILYHLTNDYEKLYKKGIWDVPEDDPEGTQIYIDKMICRKVTLALRRRIQEAIEEHLPHVADGYYHRSPYDRVVKIYRRGTKYELQNPVLR